MQHTTLTFRFRTKIVLQNGNSRVVLRFTNGGRLLALHFKDRYTNGGTCKSRLNGCATIENSFHNIFKAV